MNAENLNHVKIINREGPDVPLTDYKIKKQKTEISVFFRNHKQELMKKIYEYPFIVGCVAWLTDFDILDALATQQCMIIVQKEDFLRPDLGYPSNWKDILRKKYKAIEWDLERCEMPELNHISYLGQPSDYGIRCVGNYNSDKKPAFPRMHNKFLIFCEDTRKDESCSYKFFPREIWTGSYNFTCNAKNSLENSILINDDQIAWQFYLEFAQIFCLSEPLNWETSWIQPEYRIGS